MPTMSKGLLDIERPSSSARKQRSHSSGHVDRIEEQEQRERHERDIQMKQYHDNTRHTSSTHHRTKSEHLGVPIWESSRRPRSSDRTEEHHDRTTRSYRVEEVKPGPQTYMYDLNPEPALSEQLSVPFRGRRLPSQKQRVPTLVIQRDPPTASKPSDDTPKRSPGASPHSPTAQPVLQFQYEMLQSKMTQISDSCERYLEVEPADPQDLTFSQIREIARGFAEDLHIWSHVANLDGLARIDKSMRHLVDAASDILDRLNERASRLRDACAQAKPKDLKVQSFEAIDEGNDEEDLESDEDDYDDANVQDPTEALGFVIDSQLHSIEVQMRQLKLLSLSLQEATPDVEDEMRRVARLVKEAGKFFGSEAALRQYSIDPKFAGRKALVEARYAAGV